MSRNLALQCARQRQGTVNRVGCGFLFHPDYNRRLRVRTGSADPCKRRSRADGAHRRDILALQKPCRHARPSQSCPGRGRITAGGDLHPALRSLFCISKQRLCQTSDASSDNSRNPERGCAPPQAGGAKQKGRFLLCDLHTEPAGEVRHDAGNKTFMITYLQIYIDSYCFVRARFTLKRISHEQ